MNKFLITGYCVLVFALDCSLLPKDYTKIVGKNGEVIVQPITFFFNNVQREDQLNLTDENQKLSLIPPIEITSEVEFPQQPPFTNFITISVYTDDNYEWLNKYQILGERNEYILMTTYTFRPGTQSRAPFFNSYHTLDDPKQVKYYSSSILDQNHILIDCSLSDDQGVQTHYFYLIDEITNTKTKISNNYPYQNQQRYIQTTDQFIYRSTPKSSSNPSIIEIYQYDLQDNKINLWTTIDQQFVAQYVNNSAEYQFELIESKIGKNDEIIILDKYGNILFFQFQQIEETFQFKYIAYNLGESISFSFDFIKTHYAVLQQNKLICNFHNQQQIYITVDDLSNSQVHLAKHFVYLTSPKKIILFDQQLTLLSIQEDDFSQTLSDFKQNDLFTFNSKTIKHFQIQNDYTIKYLNNNGEEGTAKLTLNGCTVSIDYLNVDNNYPGLIQVSKGPLVDSPFFTYQTNQTQYPRHLVDGPELKLEISSDIDYVGDQIFTDQNFKSQDNIFVHVISQDFDFTSNRPYFIVVQNKDKLLTIYYCQLFLQQNCSVYATHQLQIELNNENMKLLHIEDSVDRSIYVAVLISLNKLTIHQFSQSGEHHEKSYLSEYEIDNFYFTKITDDNLLVLYSQRLQSLRAYLFSTMKILYNITPEKVKELGITNWNPQKIFANDYELWTFILNGEKEIIILNLQMNTFSIISILSIQSSKDLRVMIFQDRFGIMQLFESGKVQLQIYNKKQETYIYLEKNPSFYIYQVKSLDDLNYFSYHGVLNIKATKQEATVILTYLIDKTDHNILHSVIDVENTIKFIRSTTNKIFLFYPDYVQIVDFQFNPQIIAKSIKFENNNFVQDIESKLIYSNSLSKIELNQTFRLANTYQQVKINKKANVTLNLTSNSYDNYKRDLGIDWYSGFVSLYELTGNSNSINIISPIQQIKKDYESDSLNIADIDKDYLLILKQKEVVLMNKQTNLKEKSYSFVENLLCSNILAQEKGNLILLCSYNGKQVIQGIQCSSTKCIMGQSWMEKKENIIKTQILGEIIFIVLQLKVEVYVGSILNLEQVTLCEIEDFSHSSQLIQAITIQQVYQQSYHIYYIDYNNKLTIREYLLTNNQFQQKYNQTLDLKEFINSDYYILKHMQFQYISIINIKQGDQMFQAEFVFYSDIGPHYCIQLEFMKENDTYNLKSKQIKFIIQGYGSYRLSVKSFPFILINQDYIIIPYVGNNLILTVYQIQYSLNQSIQFLGLLKITNTQFLSYTISNQTYLLTNTDQLTLYQILNSPQLVINGSISSTQGQLKISNDYTSDSIQININVPQSDEEGGHTIIWIMIGILGGIGVFGFGFYLYKKKKPKVETFIVN